MKYISTKLMQDYERKAEELYGISTLILMENAGRSVAEFILKNRALSKKKNVLIFCGHGNNGGDGFVLARHLANYRFKPVICFVGSERKLKSDASINWKVVKKMELKCIRNNSLNGNGVEKLIQKSDFIVDALLGTGIVGAVRSEHERVIRFINNSSKKVISVDIPSGIHSDTGEVCGKAILANYTIALGYPKMGLKKQKAKKYCGKLIVGDISLPKNLR